MKLSKFFHKAFLSIVLFSITSLAFSNDTTDQSHTVTGVLVEAFGVTLDKPYKNYKYNFSKKLQNFVPESGDIGIFDDFSIELNYDNTVRKISASNFKGKYPNGLVCEDVFYNIEDFLISKYGNKIRKVVGLNIDGEAVYLSKEFNISVVCYGRFITLTFNTEKKYVGKPPYKKIEEDLGI